MSKAIQPTITPKRRKARKALAAKPPAISPLVPREQELIGCDEDGNMSLWQVGNVLPMTAFDNDGTYIISDHYVINWKNHAITVHLNGYWGSPLNVLFMCSAGNSVRMPFADVEAMLLGKVMRDLEHEARMVEGFKRLAEALAARNAAPHLKRGKIQ